MAISKDNIQISVVLPRSLVEGKLDKDAKRELRTRSKQAAKIIMDFYSYDFLDEENEEKR